MLLYAKQLGARNPEAVLFIPGFVGSHEVWDKEFQALQSDYCLILIDALGFGHSPKPNIDYTIADHINAIRDTLQSLNMTRMHIVGHSMGSLLALAYCHRYPESVFNLTLLSLPFFRNEQEAREGIKKSSLFNRLLAMDSPLAHVVCEVMCHLRPMLLPIMPYVVRDVPALVAKDAIRHTWQSYSKTLQHVIFQSPTEEWIKGIRQPVLLMHGVDDKTTPIANVRNEVQQFADARLIEVENAGHDFIFTHSSLIAAELRTFLQTFDRNAELKTG